MIIPDYVERHAKLCPEKRALIFEGRQCTYLQLQERVYRLANGLIRLGLKEGDRVAVLAENCFEYLEIYAGVAKAGGVVAPLNYRLLPGDIAHLINYVRTGFLILGAGFIPMINSIRGEIKQVRHFIALEETAEGMIGYDRLIAGSPAVNPQIRRKMEDLFCLLFTGGTTGLPKAAMLTHRNLYNVALSFIVETTLAAGDVHLVFTPLFHTAGMWPLLMNLMLGNTQVVLRSVDVDSVVEAIDQWKITYSMWMSSIIGLILNHPGVAGKKKDLSSLRLISTGGAPLPTVLVKRLIDAFDCTVTTGGGQTETGIFCSMKYNDHMDTHPERMASAGLPIITNMQFKIVDENDAEVPAGVVGEVLVRGDSVMTGYWDMPGETAESMRGGWQHTGDLCKVDEKGFLYYVDRKKDMIKSGGENVYSKEVEEVLYAHPDVLEAAVIGVPDEKWGEKVKAALVLREGKKTTEKDAIEFCKSRLAGFKCPKSIAFINALPKTAMGKIDKPALRRQMP
ncbi:MAG: long-chain-fatty-acid--CoA ligase [Desulfobacterales bacterium]|nr:long-chain-fatty-acid--CoA ligase [Desulfobacterales bacterium]